MTPKQFRKAMEIVCKSKDKAQLMRDGVQLISDELGAGVPAYLPAIYLFCRQVTAAFAPDIVEKIGGDNVIMLVDHQKPKPVK